MPPADNFPIVSDIEEFQQTIQHWYGCRSSHVGTATVTETFEGQTIWEVEVEIFQLHGHPQAEFCYAWALSKDKNGKRRNHFAVLQVPPVDSPEAAVRSVVRPPALLLTRSNSGG